MKQKRFYITYNWSRFLLGVHYEHKYTFQLHLGPFVLGVGLTKSAHGYGVWYEYK